MSKKQDRKQSEELLDIALARYSMHQNQSHEPFALPKNGPRVARFLRGGRLALRAELASAYHVEHQRVPSTNSLSDCLTLLEGLSLGESSVETHLRVGLHESDLYLDLGDELGRAVKIGTDCWQVVDQPPLVFQRTALTSALPVPDPAGDLEELTEILNVAPDAWPLLRSWLVSGLVPHVPHAILLLQGEQGSGKSTCGSILGRMFDPSPVPLRSEPRDLEQWHVAASGSWCVVLDNLSGMPPWLSDGLCKASTGDGVVKRKLYSNNDLSVVSFRRIIAMTSIDVGHLRGDLADRLAIVELRPITGTSRLTDARIASAFRESHARLLGGLLTLAGKARHVEANLPDFEMARMADFCRICKSVDVVSESDPGSLDLYLNQRGTLAADVVESDLIARAIVAKMSSNESWCGTAESLLKALEAEQGFQDLRRPKGWPTSPQALGGRLRRLQPSLLEQGIKVEHSRDTSANRTRHITLSKVEV